MYIKSIQLDNFRSWQEYSLDFKDVTILIGPNGIGKTNIVEAIWFLSSGRSWRTSKDLETVQWGKDYAKITAETSNTKDAKIELFLQQPNLGQIPKVFKLNGLKKKNLELLGQMPAVLFSPETIAMVGGAPALRRKFLDIMLSQIDRQYAVFLLEYGKVIKERNKLLFLIKIGRGKTDELDFWNEKMISIGLELLAKRKKAIGFFNQGLSEVYAEIAGKTEPLKLAYKETVPYEKFGEFLAGVQDREIEQAVTLGGPHRDDFEIRLNDKNIAAFGSRGEFRSVVLALKILELRYLEKEKKEKPILLLDDIFSELDVDRRLHLAKIVSGQQTIITTTDLDHIEEGLRKKAKIIEIK